MARTTGVILAIGGVTVARDVIADGKDIDWRVPIAAGGAAIAFALLERVNEDLAVGVAWVALVTVLLARTDPAKPSPVEAFSRYLRA